MWSVSGKLAAGIAELGISGPVVAGGLGAGSAKSYSVTGDAVNIAQRLQSLAGTSEVLVGPTTYRPVRPRQRASRWAIPLGIVLMRVRRAKEREEGISDELVDKA